MLRGNNVGETVMSVLKFRVPLLLFCMVLFGIIRVLYFMPADAKSHEGAVDMV